VCPGTRPRNLIVGALLFILPDPLLGGASVCQGTLQ
jgi:hypothetical protein